MSTGRVDCCRSSGQQYRSYCGGAAGLHTSGGQRPGVLFLKVTPSTPWRARVELGQRGASAHGMGSAAVDLAPGAPVASVPPPVCPHLRLLCLLAQLGDV
jgi:hypothetical protein